MLLSAQAIILEPLHPPSFLDVSYPPNPVIGPFAVWSTSNNYHTHTHTHTHTHNHHHYAHCFRTSPQQLPPVWSLASPFPTPPFSTQHSDPFKTQAGNSSIFPKATKQLSNSQQTSTGWTSHKFNSDTTYLDTASDPTA